MFQFQTVVTTQCNLRCKYCYIKSRNSSKYSFSLKDFDSAMAFLPDIKDTIEQYNLSNKDTAICFFGGEPLLNFSFIEKVSKKYSNYIRTLPTNGYLLPKYENQLQKLGVSYSISYDGPNNLERISVDSFPLEQTLTFMQKNAPKAMIGAYNVHCMSKNFKFFLKNKIYYPDFSLVRDDIWDNESIHVFSHQLDLMDTLASKFFDTTGILPVIGLYSLYLSDIIISNSFGKRNFTCFSGTGGVAIYSNGDIYPCARFGSNKKFKLGNYKTQELNEPLIKKLNELFNPKTNKYCIGCSIYKECNMGCNYSQLKNGKFKESKPIFNVCELLKIAYEHACNFYSKHPQIKEYLNHHLKNNNVEFGSFK